MDRALCGGMAVGFILGFVSYYYIGLFIKYRRTKGKFVIVIRTDINLKKGETAELSSEVTVECYRRALHSTPEFVEIWEKTSQPKIVLKLDQNYETEALMLKAKAEKLGLVAVAKKRARSGELVLLGVGPGPADLIQQVTGHLKLLG